MITYKIIVHYLCWYLSIVIISVTKADIKYESANFSTEANSTESNFPWPHFRLPETHFPYHYDIFIYPHPENDTFSGIVTADLHTHNWSEWVIMNQYNLTIRKIVMTSFNNSCEVTDHFSSDHFQILAIKLPTGMIPSSSRFNLTIHYEGRVGDDETEGGFFKGSYTDVDGVTTRTIYLTHFEPVDARRMIPCFDEPSFKANFTVAIVRPTDKIALSNMPLARTVKLSNNLLIDHFETSVKMSTYLLAIVICDYVHRSVYTKRGTKISTYAPRHLINQTNVVLNASLLAIDYFENLFQIPYTLPKLDLSMSDNFRPDAMENWGIILFRTNKFLHNDSQTWKNDDIIENSFDAIHEVTHQWIGNLVTAKFWNDIWLSEGITSFFSFYVSDKIFPKRNSTEYLIMDCKNNLMLTDSYDDTLSMRSVSENPDQYYDSFTDLIYDKGAFLANFLTSIIGEEKFLHIMREYLKKYRFANVEEKDFLNVLNKHSPKYDGLPLGEFIASFTNQPGIPLLTTKRLDGGLLEISQTRFYRDSTLQQNSTNQTWNVLVSVVFDCGKTKLLPLVNHSTVFNLNISKHKWYKLNVNNTGYYRINYDEGNWHALLKQLIENKNIFSPADRYGIFSDIFAFIKRNIKKWAHIFKFFPMYAEKEDNKRCFYFLITKIGEIGRLLLSTPLSESYKLYIKNIFKNVDRFIDWSLFLKTSMNEPYALRALITAAHFDFGYLRKDAYEMTYNFLYRNVSTKIFEVGRFYICCLALEYNQTIWTDIFELFLKTTIYSEKYDLYNCLLNANDSSKIYKLLDMKNNSDLVSSNALYYLNSNAEKTYWNYFKENFDERFQNITSKDFSYYLYPLNYFNTYEEYSDVMDFFVVKKMGEKEPHRIAKILKNINSNIKLKNDTINVFQSYLKTVKEV